MVGQIIVQESENRRHVIDIRTASNGIAQDQEAWRVAGKLVEVFRPISPDLCTTVIFPGSQKRKIPGACNWERSQVAAYVFDFIS